MVYKWSVRERGRDIGWKTRLGMRAREGCQSRWKWRGGGGGGEPPVEDMTLGEGERWKVGSMRRAAGRCLLALSN